MKNILILSMIVLSFACKKKTTEPTPEPTPVAPVINNYELRVVKNKPTTTTSDTLLIYLNGTLIPKSYYYSISWSGQRVKTGDIVRIYYNPGYMYSNINYPDSNRLKLYYTNDLIKDFNCICKANHTFTVQ